MTEIFDIEKLIANRLWARDHMHGHDFLFERAADILSDNFDDIARDPQDILIICKRGGEKLKDKLSNKNIYIIDFVNLKNEIIYLEEKQFDCILCLPYLHSVNDVKGFLSSIKSMLKPDGFFLCSYFGGESLRELRASILNAETKVKGGASQHIHPMIDHYQFAGLLQSTGFALPVVNFDRVTVEYSDLNNLYKDLRNMGEGNALKNRETTIHDFKGEIETFYKDNFYNDGYVATFDIVHGIGWAPHDSQQKPSKRGSGQVSLTEIL